MSEHHGQHVKVTITGAAGRISYSLIPLILNGMLFGKDTTIDLRLLDIPMASDRLHGVRLEIEDSNYDLLYELVTTTDPTEAFKDTEVAILLGGFPRLAGMERKDLLIKNAENIRSQAQALNQWANPNVKVIVVANPANTNCLVAIKTATNIPASNFTCLTRLDEERLRGLVAQKASKSLSTRVSGADIQNVYILGNHSTTQVAHIHDAVIINDRHHTKVVDFFSEFEYDELLRKVQNRGAEIIKYTQVSSASSAAEAIVKHLKDWLAEMPSSSGPFSMGVLSNGNSYGIPDDLVFSFPCVRAFDDPAGYHLLKGVAFSSKTRALIDKTIQELIEEREQVRDFLT